MPQPKIVVSEEEIRSCFPVMKELRSHLSEEEFLERVQRQMAQGYHLALLEGDAGEVSAVAGFRISDNLAWGKFMYVDDLVTSAISRSKGLGRELFDWLVDHAKSEGCDALHLDSGVQRFDAHRFYLQCRMKISSHHFVLPL